MQLNNNRLDALTLGDLVLDEGTGDGRCPGEAEDELWRDLARCDAG